MTIINEIFRGIADNERKVAEILTALKTVMNEFLSSPYGQEFHDVGELVTKYNLDDIEPTNHGFITIDYRAEHRQNQDDEGDENYTNRQLSIDIYAQGYIEISPSFGSFENSFRFQNSEDVATITSRIICAVLSCGREANVYDKFFTYARNKMAHLLRSAPR